jgi:transcriptional regulator of aromatic amino acid metabolism
MAQPQDPIDAILAELRQDLSNRLTMINMSIALRRNNTHLLGLVRQMLQELCTHIDQALPSLPSDEAEDR